MTHSNPEQKKSLVKCRMQLGVYCPRTYGEFSKFRVPFRVLFVRVRYYFGDLEGDPD